MESLRLPFVEFSVADFSAESLLDGAYASRALSYLESLPDESGLRDDYQLVFSPRNKNFRLRLDPTATGSSGRLPRTAGELLVFCSKKFSSLIEDHTRNMNLFMLASTLFSIWHPLLSADDNPTELVLCVPVQPSLIGRIKSKRPAHSRFFT